MPTRVALVHGNNEWYGADRALVLLASALRRRGIEVEVVVPEPGVVSAALQAEGLTPVVTDVVPYRGRVFGRARTARYIAFDLPASIVRTYRIARRVDIVHLNTSNLVGSILGAALARRPVVLHVRETYAGDERQWRLYCRLFGRIATRVIATSDAIASEVATEHMRARTQVIHDGLDFSDRQLVACDGPVIAVGRLNDWKGHDVLIDAIALLRSHGIDVPAEIAGDAFPGRERRADELVALAAARGVSDLVTFLGFVDDVPALLERTGIFVQPSIRPEPFGLALLEAMSRGLPCIATDAGGPRDVVQQGTTGFLVKPRDPAALADAIEHLWRDPELRRRVGEAAAADVRHRFSIDASADRVAALYEELTSTR